MVATAVAVKLGTWAFAALSAGLKLGGLEATATLAEMGGKTVEAGAAVLERPRDVVRRAASRLAGQIEYEHRAWLAGEFGSDAAGRADIDGLLAAMPDVAVSVLSDLPALIEADLDPSAFAAAAVTRVGRTDERFRPDTTGARLLGCLLLNVYTAARADTEFTKAMTLAVQQALLERTTRLAAGQQRIAATLAVGAKRLHLLARHHRKAAPANLRQLLMAEMRATDLVGRQEELQPLQMWLAVKGDGSDISAHCLTGQGGAGKTRLAIELCEWAERAGWSAGFVRHEELASFRDRCHPSEWQWDRPTLVVVDYAAAFGPRAAGLAGGAGRRRRWPAGAPAAHPAAGTGRRPRDRLVVRADPPGRPLRPRSRHPDRPAGAAAARPAARRGRPSRAAGPGDATGRAFPVAPAPAAAGLIAIAEALPDQTLALRKRAAEITGRIVTGLAPLAASDPGLRWLHAGWVHNLAIRLSELGDREAALSAAREAVDIRRALAAQRPDALRPDLALSLNNLANRLSALGDREAALSAAREAADLYRVLAAQRPDAFRPALAMSLNNLANRLSELGDRDSALSAAREAVDIRRALAAQCPDAFRPALAMSLTNLANRLSELGDREAALSAARQAADLYRALGAQHPDAFRPALAMSLNTLANRLSELGDREAALSAAREAADLYRALAAQRPDAFRPDLALSLNNLATMLIALGDRESALSAAREAVDIRRALAAQRPDAFRPNLAMSLNNLAAMLSALADREVALSAAREAADLYRALAAQRPDAFRPDLAMSLNNLAIMLSELGDRDSALSAAREAVDIRRALAAQRPDAFLPNLAASLNTLAIRLSELGDRKAALSAAREAADLCRVLAAQRPDAFRPDLAVSLWVLADCLDAVGRQQEGLAANAEALAELSEPFQRDRRAFADRIVGMVQEYRQRCEALGLEPDQRLLAPAAEGLAALRAETPTDPEPNAAA